MAIRLGLCFVLILYSASGWTEAYYWVDDKGKRHYSDRVPAQESKRERKIIDDRGFTVETLPRQKTQAEVEAEQAALEAARKKQEQEAKQEAERNAYDSILLTTYQDVSEIEHARDDRLSLMEGSLLVAEQIHEDNKNRLQTLRDREKALMEKGRPVSNKLRAQIVDVIGRIRVYEQNILELKRQRDATAAKYQRDIDRFNELKSAAN